MSTPYRIAHEDPGLQPERTILAWVRTLLALVVCAMLFVRWIPIDGWPAVIPLGLAMLGGAAIFAGRSRMRVRAVRAILQERNEPPVVPILALTGLIMVVGLCAIVVI
ncbi:DUF202 domain-containing protein [Epidermidibacterium keratini]|uniref:DUF202 domain-containing protein n=1 Tax=Epidermidibacterium keratini TaxID=1891644 RepID=A0A7L4YNY8_9ACTN|nr:DUF202 domain-containing protein [Epidermidibacterium keratini]QHC00788.1 DUF202 domain-containing protein [Epidermidibacterium keratini]